MINERWRAERVKLVKGQRHHRWFRCTATGIIQDKEINMDPNDPYVGRNAIWLHDT